MNSYYQAGTQVQIVEGIHADDTVYEIIRHSEISNELCTYELHAVEGNKRTFVKTSYVRAVGEKWPDFKYEVGQLMLLNIIDGSDNKKEAGVFTINHRYRKGNSCMYVSLGLHVAEKAVCIVPRKPKFALNDQVINTESGQTGRVVSLTRYDEKYDVFVYKMRYGETITVSLETHLKAASEHVKEKEAEVREELKAEQAYFNVGDIVKHKITGHEGLVIKSVTLRLIKSVTLRLVDIKITEGRSKGRTKTWRKDHCELVKPAEQYTGKKTSLSPPPPPKREHQGCQHTDLRKRRYSDTYICCEMLKKADGKPGIFSCGEILSEIPRDGVARCIDGILQTEPIDVESRTRSDFKGIKAEANGGMDSTTPILDTHVDTPVKSK